MSSITNNTPSVHLHLNSNTPQEATLPENNSDSYPAGYLNDIKKLSVLIKELNSFMANYNGGPVTQKQFAEITYLMANQLGPLMASMMAAYPASKSLPGSAALYASLTTLNKAWAGILDGGHVAANTETFFKDLKIATTALSNATNGPKPIDPSTLKILNAILYGLNLLLNQINNSQLISQINAEIQKLSSSNIWIQQIKQEWSSDIDPGPPTVSEVESLISKVKEVV